MKWKPAFLLVGLMSVGGAEAAPRYVCLVAERDLGVIREGERVSAEFTITNAGDEPLVLELDRGETCSCTDIVLDSTVIAPGTSQVATLIYNSTGERGREQQVLKIRTNDPELPETALVLTVDVSRSFWVRPAALALGEVAQDDRVEASVEIRAEDLDSGLRISNVTSSHHAMRAEAVPGETPEQSVVLQVVVDTFGVPPGWFEETLEAHTNYPGRALVRIPVTAQIQGAIRPDPSNLMLMRVPADKGHTGEVEIAAHDGMTRFTLVTATYTGLEGPQLECMVKTIEPQIRYLVAVKVPPGRRGERFRGTVTANTDHPAQPEVTFTVNGRYR